MTVPVRYILAALAFGVAALGFFLLGGDAFVSERPILRLKLGSIHPPAAKAPKGLRLAVVND